MKISETRISRKYSRIIFMSNDDIKVTYDIKLKQHDGEVNYTFYHYVSGIEDIDPTLSVDDEDLNEILNDYFTDDEREAIFYYIGGVSLTMDTMEVD